MPEAPPDEAVNPARKGRSPCLDNLARVRREAVRLHREGRDGSRPAGGVHRLAATPAIVGRPTEGGRP